jgi:DNA polymerase-3 subunit delta'
MLNWNDIQGHEATRDVLERALQNQRVHHAYLFSGPEGVGKKQMAFAMAAILNCTNRSNQAPFQPQCGRCTHCLRIARDQHPDLHTVKPDGQFIKIDQIRVIQKAASTRPYEAAFQVVIIDDAHRMTDEAANALLKTLEEPPLTMRLILITSQAHLVLDTIRSRCQLVRFGSLSPEIVEDLLRENTKTSDPQPSPNSLKVAARLGEGSVGRALHVLQDGLLDRREDLLNTLLRVHRDNPRSLLDEAETLAREKAGFLEGIELLRIILRDVLLARSVPPEAWQNLAINTDLEGPIHELANRMGSREIMECIRSVNGSQNLLDRNVNPLLVAEELLATLALHRTSLHSGRQV